MNTVKITKKDNFVTLRNCVLENSDWFEEGVADRLIEFIDHEMEQLEKRSASAKKYAKKSAKAEDDLADAIAAVLQRGEGAMTIADIIAALDENYAATPQKVTYRLNKMVEAGTVTKDSVSIKEEGKVARKINCYKWADAE